MKFTDLKLEPTLQSAIDKLGYSECTPVQAATMPIILEGKDVSGLAQTGTGKTAAFLVPLMDRILRGRTPLDESLTEEQKALLQKQTFTDWRSQNFVLILVPTRELAEQVYENIVKLSEFSGLRGASVYGGTGYDKQKEAFKNGVEFVVATPGRLIDLYKEHFVDLKQVRAIVFDEADRMFDMGFKDDMKYILQRVPRERQFLVFSATLNFDVLNTAYQFGAEPVEINVSKDQAKAENVKDKIFHVGTFDKPSYILSTLKKYNPKQVIVFSNFKMNVERLAAFLSANGYPAMAISSLLSQAQRNRVIELFKSENEQNILVATDVAARGLDIKGVDMVINYELPQDAESYVHRIGRTGRAGTEGQAFSFVSDRDVESLSRIEDYLKHKVDIGWMEDADLIKDFKPFPEESYSGGYRTPRNDNGRPPQRGGGQGDRPRRNEARGGQGGGGQGSGPRTGGRNQDRRPPRDGDRGPRPERRDHRGPRNENGPGSGPGPAPARAGQAQGGRAQGPRHEGKPRSGPQSNSNRPRNENSNRGGNGKPQSARPQSGPGRRPQPKVHPSVAQKGVVQKVTGFLKKIFGN